MKHQFANGYIETSLHQGILQLEFFQEQSNSMPSDMLEQLATEIHGAGNNDDVRVIILRSGGDKTFCSGASFEELSSLQNEADGLRFFSGFSKVINSLRAVPKLVIGRIQGKCVGGGVGLAAACDYAIATEQSSVKLSELAIGIGAFVIGPVVERRIGNAAFMQLCIDASNWRSAEWAHKKGLFAELHSDIASLNDSVEQLSSKLASYHPTAIKELKKIFWEGTENWDTLLLERASISGKLALSDFTRQAIQQFKNRKK